MALKPSDQIDTGEQSFALTPEDAAQKAYRRSAYYEFGGLKLEPFSAGRENTAFVLGYSGGVVGEGDFMEAETLVTVPVMDGEKQAVDEHGALKFEKAERTVKIYRKFVRDVQLILWLCSQPKSACMRAERKQEWAVEQAMEFAELHGIRWGHPRFEKAAEVFSQIMEDKNASYAEPEKEDSETRRADPGN